MEDRVIYVWRNGQWVKVAEPTTLPGYRFLITCSAGDWSGFRTLEQCLAQKMFGKMQYQIVER